MLYQYAHFHFTPHFSQKFPYLALIGLKKMDDMKRVIKELANCKMYEISHQTGPQVDESPDGYFDTYVVLTYCQFLGMFLDFGTVQNKKL